MNFNDMSMENTSVLSSNYIDDTEITNGICGYLLDQDIKNVESFSKYFAIVQISGGYKKLCDKNSFVKFQCCAIEQVGELNELFNNS